MKEQVEFQVTMKIIQDLFTKSMYDISSCAEEVIKPLLKKEDKAFKEFKKYISNFSSKNTDSENEENVENEENDDNEFDVNINAGMSNDEMIALLKVIDKYSKSNKSNTIIKSLFLNLFSEFDAYTNNLLYFIFTKKEGTYDKSEKNFSAIDVLKYDSIETFKNAIIEKEIDSIIRKSYVEQFSEFEKKFKIRTLKEFDNWPRFVEITQRRNLMMHCNGKVSDQYLKICKSHKCNVNDVKVNDIVSISHEYLLDSINLVHEVGIKLHHTVWRTQFPEDLTIADKVLRDHIYDLLCDNSMEMAQTIGKFACDQKNISNNEHKYIVIINYCIALKSLSMTTELKKEIDKHDWTNVLNEFKLAKHILCEEFEAIPNIMKKIGTESEYFSKKGYCVMPLFNFVQNNQKFLDSFNEIFEDDYSILKNSYEIQDKLSF